MKLILSTLMIIALAGCIKKGEVEEGNSVAPSWNWKTPQSSTLNLTREVETFAGYTDGNLISQDGIGTYALFSGLAAITTDRDYLYVTDGSAIRKIHKSSTEVTTITGQYDSYGSNTDGEKAVALLDTPQGITVLGNYLYVTDTQNTIRKIEIASGRVSTIAGSKGLTGSTNGIGSSARFNDPRGIITDGTFLYIADSGNNMIRKLNLSTNEVSTVAGAPAAGYADGVGSIARFNFPFNLTSDGTYLYVIDGDNYNVRKINVATGLVTTFAGSATGLSGSADGRGQNARFNGLYNITSDASYLYLTDWTDCTIRKISKSTADVSTIAGTLGQCTVLDGGFGHNELSTPMGIVADKDSLYFVDMFVVRRLK